MNIQQKLLRAVMLEADMFYNDAKEFGVQAARSLGSGKRSQVTGLESIANSSYNVSDVLDYLKLRIARQKEWREDSFGEALLKYMEADLEKKRTGICGELRIVGQSFEDNVVRQEIYMLLVREFVKQIAVQYEFACQQSEGNAS